MPLKLRAPRPPAQLSWNDSSSAPRDNTPFPLKRSPPASFKRLLGGLRSGARGRQCQVTCRADISDALNGRTSAGGEELARKSMGEVQPALWRQARETGGRWW